MSQLGAIPAAATLGFLYLSDSFSEELDAILDFFKSATGVSHWVGTVGVGVCATGVEYLEVPAMAVMLGEFSPADFQILPLQRTVQDIAAQPLDGAYFAMVHGDPRNAQMQDLIEALSARMSSGFVVGGLTSSRGEMPQIADTQISGGLSGVGDVRERIGRKLSFGHGVVLELEVRRELHELGPVGTRARTHRVAEFSSSIHLPSKRTTPRSSPPG